MSVISFGCRYRRIDILKGLSGVPIIGIIVLLFGRAYTKPLSFLRMDSKCDSTQAPPLFGIAIGQAWALCDLVDFVNISDTQLTLNIMAIGSWRQLHQHSLMR